MKGQELETTITGREIPNVVQDIFLLTNQEREDAGRQQLAMNEKLLHAAQKYAELMANKDELGHAVDGQTVRIRLSSVDYRWRTYGENVAYNGRPDAQRVMQQWMGSRGHRENILSPNFQEIGIGVYGPSRRNRIYYCQIFGRPAGTFFKDVTMVEQSSSITAEGGEDSADAFSLLPGSKISINHFSHVLNRKEPYYINGPQNPHGPDGCFEKGNHVLLVNEGGSYSWVIDKRHIHAAVASDSLTKL